MNKKKLFTFVFFAYGISWLIWMPNVLAHNFKVGWEHSNWLHIAGGLGPFLGAVITTYLFEKRAGVTKYFRGKLFTLPRLKWVLVGLGMPLVFFLIVWLILGILTGEWVAFTDLGLNAKLPTTNPLLIWLLWCFFYGLGEEGGWRGFLFPELTKNFKARIATLYVVFIWAPWHLPVFFYDKDLSAMGFGGTIGWLIGLVFGSLLLGWLVKQAQFSLWPVILWHGTFNFFTTSDRIDPLIPGILSFMVIMIVLWIARRYGENLERDKKMTNNESNHITYKLKIKGHLDKRWEEWFEGLTIVHESDGTTTLSGSLPDQASLHSVLLKIRDMNLTLISVTQSESNPGKEAQPN